LIKGKLKDSTDLMNSRVSEEYLENRLKKFTENQQISVFFPFLPKFLVLEI